MSIRIFRSSAPRRRAAALALTAGLAVGAGAFIAGCSGPIDAQAGRPPPPSVSVAPAVQRQVADSEEFSGRLEAAEYVELRPRVSGTIDKVHFVDGAYVRKGDLLFSIDPRPFAAEVAKAESTLATMRARAELAQIELARAQKLVDAQAVSKQEVDQLASGSRTSQADIQGAEASLRVARLNLEYALVRAPISGRISRANVTSGNVVNEQSVLTTIAGTQTVYAYFDGSERTYLQLQSAQGAQGSRSGSGAPKVRMALVDEQGFPHEGRVDFIDNRLNAQTGAIRMRASFDNAAGKFTPGLSARLRMESGTAVEEVLVPERAIGTDQTKKFVFVVGEDGKPQFREVKLGMLSEGMRVVHGGVQPGDNVVVDGLQRIQPGMPVTPQVLKVDAKGLPIFPAPGAAPAAAQGDADKKPTAKS